jgi:hypothetical protein
VSASIRAHAVVTAALIAACALPTGGCRRQRPPRTERLVASIGMPIAKVRQLSTLNFGDGYAVAALGETAFAHPVNLDARSDPFEFVLAPAGPRFEACGYFTLDTETVPPQRTKRIVLGVGTQAVPWPEAPAAVRDVRRRIEAAGFSLCGAPCVATGERFEAAISGEAPTRETRFGVWRTDTVEIHAWIRVLEGTGRPKTYYPRVEIRPRDSLAAPGSP